MGRIYKRTTNRENISETQFRKAILAVLKNEMTVRHAALQYGIKKSTLFNRIQKSKKAGVCFSQNDDSGNSEDDNAPLGRLDVSRTKFKHRQIFSDHDEVQLKKYLLFSSKINFGLTYIQTRTLAYEYAVLLKRNFPASWNTNKVAGVEWMKGFMTRNSNLSLRKPENTSMARSSAFNKTNVSEFFENLRDVMARYKFSPTRILNLDETGITTVLQTPKVKIN